MKRLLPSLMTLMLIWFCSCYTPNKAKKDIDKAYKHHPNEVAKFAADKYPCKDGIIQVVHDTSYDFIEIACPDGINDTIYKRDTVTITQKIKGKTIEVQKVKVLKIPSDKVIITKYVKDSAQLAVLYGKIKSLEDDKIKLSYQCEKRQESIKWLLIALAVCLLIITATFWAMSLSKK